MPTKPATSPIRAERLGTKGQLSLDPLLTFALRYGHARTPLVLVVPDPDWPDTWRIAWPDGRLSGPRQSLPRQGRGRGFQRARTARPRPAPLPLACLE
jgi:hypothetical protein